MKKTMKLDEISTAELDGGSRRRRFARERERESIIEGDKVRVIFVIWSLMNCVYMKMSTY